MPTLTTPTTVTFLLEIDQILTLTNNFGAGRVVLSAQKGGDVVFDYTNNQLQNAPIFSSGSQGLVTITHLSGSLTYNVSASVISGAGLSANSFTGTQTITPPVGSSALVVASTIQTTSQPVLDLAQTWNAGGVTFTGLRLNVTNTASAAASLLMDLQVGGSSKLSVDRDGTVSTAGDGNFAFKALSNSGFGVYSGATLFAWLNVNGLTLRNDRSMNWSSSGDASGSVDLRLFRDAANTLAQRNGTAAQTFRNYGTWTDASNGRWLNISMTTAGVATITPTGNGTGASGNVLHISGMPTSNPGPGILWNNAGTPAIGT